MVQILPQIQPTGIGAGLGQGLLKGLDNLAQHKMQQMHMQQKAKSWESIGVPPEYANFLVQQPEWVQKEVLSRLEGLGGSPQQSMMQGQPQSQQQGMQQSLGGVPQASVQSQQPASGVRLGMSQEEKKRAHENQKLINKEVFPYIKEVQSKATGAKENNIRLNRMENLIETGKLNNPQYASLLKTLKHGVWGVGLDLTNLLSRESQEFEKISNDFIKNAKDVFGSRITDVDLKSFLATIPNLSQTNEGKLRVIRNLKLMNQAAELKNEASRKLLKHYGNRPPLDFESQVNDLIKPELDALSDEFEKGSSKTPKTTTTLLGDIVGGVGQSLFGNQ